MSAYTFLLFTALMVTLKISTINCTHFPMELYDALLQGKEAKTSAFMSPIGIRSSLAAAARLAGGKTKREIMNTIEKPDVLVPDIGYKAPKNFELDSLKTDRVIYLNEHMDLGHVKDLVSDAYTFYNISFGTTEATKLVNNFVKTETKRWVENILPNSLNRDTAIAMINSMYFHSSWKTEFTSTMKRGFKKPMLHQYNTFMYANLTDLNAAVLEMEFNDNDAKLLVFQPNDDDLERLVEELQGVDLTQFDKRLNSTYMSLFFPIINEIKMSVSLKDALESMGVEEAFTEKPVFSELLYNYAYQSPAYIKEMRQHTSFKCGRENARFVAVTGTQWDLVDGRRKCVCIPDENSLQFANPDDITEDVLMVPMRKVQHYYFEHKLFFTLIHHDEVIFVGTVAEDK